MTAGEKLLWDMKVTAGARFNAAARLNAKDRFNNISIAIYSAIVVSTSIIGLTFDLGQTNGKLVGVGALIASIIILVLSMKLFADRSAVDAEQMHRCALEINELRRRCIVVGLDAPSDLLLATDQYNAILQKYSINHSERDYLKYKFSHRWEFDDLRDISNRQVNFREATGWITANLIEKLAASAGLAGLAAAVASFLGILNG